MVKHFTCKVRPTSVFPFYQQKTNYPGPRAEMEFACILPLAGGSVGILGKPATCFYHRQQKRCRKHHYCKAPSFLIHTPGVLPTHPTQVKKPDNNYSVIYTAHTYSLRSKRCDRATLSSKVTEISY